MHLASKSRYSCATNTPALLGIVIVVVTFFCAPQASAREYYVPRVPNGDAGSRSDSGFKCEHLGHDRCEHGSPRNPFGKDFEFIGKLQWTKELCEQDSDGDGLTNGEELGDPCCLWTVDEQNPRGFRTTGLSHPGDKDSVADKANAVCPKQTASDQSAASETSSSPSKSKEDNKSASCFPSSALVEIQGGTLRRMDALKEGDRVRVSSGFGPGAYNDIYMFTHQDSKAVSRFLRIETATRSSNPLVVSSDHYIRVYRRGLVTASAIRVGDLLLLALPGINDVGIASLPQQNALVSDIVTSVSVVEEKGLFNPQTLHGDIVVNGYICSTYTAAVRPQVAEHLLAPFRALYRRWSLKFRLFPWLSSKMHDRIASLAPRGSIAEDL